MSDYLSKTSRPELLTAKIEQVLRLYLVTVMVVQMLCEEDHHLLACLQGAGHLQIFTLSITCRSKLGSLDIWGDSIIARVVQFGPCKQYCHCLPM